METEALSRRTLLESAVRVAATPVGIAFLERWSQAAEEHQHAHGSSAPPPPSTLASYEPQFFPREDFDALRSLTEILIPTDETPGAREAHCAEFIDFMLHAMEEYSPETQKQWRSAMTALKTCGFHSAAPEARVQIIDEIAKPERDPKIHHSAFFAYRLIKRENAFAFYTAHAGLIDTLDYRGNTYNVQFPACTHPEHHEI